MAGHFAAQLALIAFAVCEARGLLSGADFVPTTRTALLAACALALLGFVTGELARRIVEESALREFQTAVNANESTDQPDEASTNSRQS